MTAVKKASLDELRELSWLPDAVADAVYAKLHGTNGTNGTNGTPRPPAPAATDAS